MHMRNVNISRFLTLWGSQAKALRRAVHIDLSEVKGRFNITLRLFSALRFFKIINLFRSTAVLLGNSRSHI